MIKFLVELIVGIFKMLFPILKDASKDTYIQADPDKKLRKRLRDRVKGIWGKSVILICFSFAFVGCGTKTVYVPDGTPVKLRETLKDVKIWVKDADGNTIATTMDIPEGWFALPDSND